MAVIAITIAVAVAIVCGGGCCASLKINRIKGILIPIVIHGDVCAVLLLMMLLLMMLLLLWMWLLLTLKVVLVNVCGCNCWVGSTIMTKVMSEGSR